MRESRTSGSEGGGALIGSPYPYNVRRRDGSCGLLGCVYTSLRNSSGVIRISSMIFRSRLGEMSLPE